MENKDIENRLILSYYKEITVLNKEHGIFIVQHTETGKLYVKKKAALYSKPVYEQLKKNPVQGVPKTIELIELDNELIIIEEHVSGHNLGEILEKEGPLNKERVIDYCIKLCDILTALHTLNTPIIHRDIKPSNVILTEDNRIVLIDLDGAKLADPNESRDTHLIGSTGFAAPEQYGFASSNAQTDIYGIGKLMVALLTDDTDIKKVSDKSLSNIINKCLQMDPSKRYASAKQLKHALILYGSRKKVLVAICAIVLVIGICVVVGSISKNSSKEEPITESQTSEITTSSSLDTQEDIVDSDNAYDTNEQNINAGDLASVFSNANVDNTAKLDSTSNETKSLESTEIDMNSPTGAYVGDDKEELVICDNGLAYYYCSEPSFIEVECPWEETNNTITIKLAKLHCDIKAKVQDNDYSELIFKSDSVNWNSEVFDKISSNPDEHIVSPPKQSSTLVPVRDNGDLVVDIGSFRFLVPKQFRDNGYDVNHSKTRYILVDTNADEYFVASALFILSDTPGNNLSNESKDLSKEIASQFFDSVQIGHSEVIKVAGQDAYRTNVSGLLNSNFTQLSNQIVSGSVVLINDPSTNRVLYLFLVQTVGTKTDDTEAFEYILKEAVIR